jgi:alpha-galactosidase
LVFELGLIKMRKQIFFIILILSINSIFNLNNGLALTPPMGFNTWNQFLCNINESLIIQMIDSVIRFGYKDAGYQYINIDDCWHENVRDSNGRLQANSKSYFKFNDRVSKRN